MNRSSLAGFDPLGDMASIVIPNSVNRIGDVAFGNCGLTSVVVPNSVTQIGNYAFSWCLNLTNITIGTGVTNIGRQAFSVCINLTSITIPSNVTSMGYLIFDSCTSLKGVYFQGNAPVIELHYGLPVLYYSSPLIVYYLPGTTGWDTFTSARTAPWLPQMQSAGVNTGGPTNQFEFNISWASDKTVVVEVCSDLANPDWQPVQTNTLTTGSAYFSDPQWTNYPSRFYRLCSP